MNIRSFFKGPQRFTTQQVSDLCDYGHSVWDDREGDKVIQNHNLRKITVCLAAACVVLSCGLVYESMRSTVEPYIVEVDTTTGEVRKAGVMSEMNYQPQEVEYAYFIGEFVKKTRTMPLDPVVYKKNWEEAYNFLTRDAATKMNAQVQQDKVAEDFGKKTVQVQIVSILPVDGSSSSFQVRWNEEIFVPGSGEKQVIPMTGTFTITRLEVKEKEKLQLNPLSMYISDFNMQKDTTAATTSKKQDGKPAASAPGNNAK